MLCGGREFGWLNIFLLPSVSPAWRVCGERWGAFKPCVTSQCIFTFHHPFSLSSITFPCISCVHNVLFCSSLIIPTVCTFKHIICSISFIFIIKKMGKWESGGGWRGGGEVALVPNIQSDSQPQSTVHPKNNWSAFCVSKCCASVCSCWAWLHS